MAKDDDIPETEDDPFMLFDGRQSPTAAAVQRGCSRLIAEMGFVSATEIPLATGRRVDIMALGPKNEVHVFEIKSSLADFRADSKWEEYLEFCDRFYFAGFSARGAARGSGARGRRPLRCGDPSGVTA